MPELSDDKFRLAALERIFIRGSAIAPAQPFVLKLHGPEGWKRCLETLAPAERALLEQPVIATNWYPFVLALGIVDWLAANGSATVLRQFAIDNLDFATNFVFRAIFKIGSPEFMIARSD